MDSQFRSPGQLAPCADKIRHKSCQLPFIFNRFGLAWTLLVDLSSCWWFLALLPICYHLPWFSGFSRTCQFLCRDQAPAAQDSSFVRPWWLMLIGEVILAVDWAWTSVAPWPNSSFLSPRFDPLGATADLPKWSKAWALKLSEVRTIEMSKILCLVVKDHSGGHRTKS